MTKQILGNRILIRFDKTPETAPDGAVFLLEPSRERPSDGEVIAVGTGDPLKPRVAALLPEVRVGDRVRVDRNYASVKLPNGDEIFSIADVQLIYVTIENVHRITP